MAKIDWAQVAGQVVGSIVNLFAPGAGAVTQKVIENGIDIAAGVVQKIKTGKEAGKTDAQVSETLTAQERAQLVAETNEQAILNAKIETAFQDWVNSQSAADRMLSKWRKSAKMAGKNPDAAETFNFDPKTGTMTYGKESLNVSDLVIFAGFPNFRTSNQVLADIMTSETMPTGGGTQENLVTSEVEDEFQGPGSQEQQTRTKKQSWSWLLLLLLAGLAWWFLLRIPSMKRLKQLKAARAAKKRKAAMDAAEKKAAAQARAEQARKTKLQNQKKSK